MTTQEEVVQQWKVLKAVLSQALDLYRSGILQLAPETSSTPSSP
jgi:hypothetical protein